jgi:hypothetical protein
VVPIITAVVVSLGCFFIAAEEGRRREENRRREDMRTNSGIPAAASLVENETRNAWNNFSFFLSYVAKYYICIIIFA